jgi:hypothetical protein
MPSLPPPIKGELFYDGAWNEATQYLRQTEQIEITRGTTSEGGQPDPTEATLLLDNRTGDLSPRNPNSPLYNKIGRNTPMRISVDAGYPWLDLPDVAASRARTPDNAALDITGDIDVRVEAALISWNRNQTTEICNKQQITGDQRSWRLMQASSNKIEFTWSVLGTSASAITVTSTMSPVVAPGGRIALRATLDVDNGLGGYTCTLWTAPTIAGPWKILGEPLETTAGTTSIFNSTSPLDVGDTDGIVLAPPIGKFYAFQLYNGINGTLVADADFTGLAVGTTAWTDSVGRSWALNSAASISNTHARIVGEVPAWPPRRSLSGTDVRVPVAPTGIMRRLGSGSKPIKSAAFRSITFNSPDAPILAYWPCEDGKEASSVASGLPGGPAAALTFGPLSLSDSDVFVSSDPLPTMANGVIEMPVPRYTTTGESQMRFFMNLPAGGTTNNAVLARMYTTGTAKRIKLVYGTGGTLNLVAYDVDDVVIDQTGGVAFGANGKICRFSIGLTQNGANVDITIGLLEANATSALVFTDTLVGFTVGRVFLMSIGSPDDLDDTTMGHVTFQSTETNLFDIVEQLDGYKGERAGTRIVRLCQEQGLVATYSGFLDEQIQLGPQRSDKFVEVLQVAARADLGFLLERRDLLELYLRDRSTLYNQTPKLTLDYSQGLISPPFDPDDDDKLTKNSVIVQVDEGSSSAPAVLETGRMSIQDPPDGVGLYDVEETYSLDSVGKAEDMSYWILHTGTFDGLRYTRLTLDLANDRVNAYATDILETDVGDLIRLTNLPEDLPPGDVDLIVIGYTEEMGPTGWKITFACIPGEPYKTIEVPSWNREGDYESVRWDTAGAALTAAITSSTATTNITTTADFVFTEDPEDTPFLASIGDGEIVKVASIAPVISSNPYFDTNSTGWALNNSTIVRSTDFIHPDAVAASLKITPNGVSASGGANNDISAVDSIQVGGTYRASLWVYSPQGWTDFRPVVDWYTSGGVFVSSSLGSALVVPADEWICLQQDLVAPATANRVVMRARFGGTPAASVMFYVWGVRVTHSKSLTMYDTFTRTETDTWGRAELGGSWANTGGVSTDFDVNGTAGTHTMTTVNASRVSTATAPSADVDISCAVASNDIPTGASQFVGAIARFTDVNNLYLARLEFTTASVITLTLRKRVGGVETQLGTFTVPATFATNTFYRLRFQVIGSALKVKTWTQGAREPGFWQIEATDTEITATGSVGVRSIISTGNTDVNPIMSYSDYSVTNIQRMDIVRSHNGVVRAWSAGDDVRLSPEPVYSL